MAGTGLGFHKTDDRGRSHLFVGTVAYYLHEPMHQRLALLFPNDGRGKRRRWGLPSVMQSLRQMTHQCGADGESAA